MPEKGKNKLAFKNHPKQLPAPFIIYADFEALTTKVEGRELDPTKSYTQRTQHHGACSYSYIVVRCDGQTEPPVEYSSPNAAEHLLKSLQEEESKSRVCEVFRQLDKPPTCGSQGPRSLSSYVASKQEACRARKNRRCWPIHCMRFFKLHSEFVGHHAGRVHSQYNEGNLSVSLATARHVEGPMGQVLYR